jgi:exodeoxyribonuclease-3
MDAPGAKAEAASEPTVAARQGGDTVHAGARFGFSAGGENGAGGAGPACDSIGDVSAVSVVSWNANGLRARLTKREYGFLLADDGSAKYDVVCIQETKAEERQLDVPADLCAAYPYRFYESTRFVKGQSGTGIWSRIAPRVRLPAPPTDLEGRICAADLGSFVIASVYVPNSGTKHTFRTGMWHATFAKYLDYLQHLDKPVVVCMDANVCHEDIDIYAPDKHRNKVAGFYDIEREQFAHYLTRGYRDAFRARHPEVAGAYTWFNPRAPHMRERNLGWRLDVVLVSRGAQVVACDHLADVRGSDHIPVVACVQVPVWPASDRLVPRAAPAAPARTFCTEWLRPLSAVMERLGSECALTVAARRALHVEWAKSDLRTATLPALIEEGQRQADGEGDGGDHTDAGRCTGQCGAAGGAPLLDAGGLGEPGEPGHVDVDRGQGDAALLSYAVQSLRQGEGGLAHREQTRRFFAADGLGFKWRPGM